MTPEIAKSHQNWQLYLFCSAIPPWCNFKERLNDYIRSFCQCCLQWAFGEERRMFFDSHTLNAAKSRALKLQSFNSFSQMGAATENLHRQIQWNLGKTDFDFRAVLGRQGHSEKFLRSAISMLLFRAVLLYFYGEKI